MPHTVPKSLKSVSYQVKKLTDKNVVIGGFEPNVFACQEDFTIQEDSLTIWH